MCLIFQIPNMPQLIDLIIADELDIQQPEHILHVCLATGKACHPSARDGDFGGGGIFKYHVRISVLCAEAYDIGKGEKFPLKLMYTISIVPHQQKIRS